MAFSFLKLSSSRKDALTFLESKFFVPVSMHSSRIQAPLLHTCFNTTRLTSVPEAGYATYHYLVLLILYYSTVACGAPQNQLVIPHRTSR